ncbi:MAG: DUF6431 domain-containing protein [Succinivibrio sp.]
MHILPYQLFNVEYCKGRIPKFVPSPTVFAWLDSSLGATSIRIHSYIKRQIKQIGVEPKLILIPRIICTFKEKRKRTHNLLPDFVLPYCNYTVKSLACVFSTFIPTKTASRFKLSDWDRFSTIACSNRNKRTCSYIKQRGSKLFYRYGIISKMIVLFRQARECKLYYSQNSLNKYYFFDSNSICINVLSYLEHTISNFHFP